MKVLIQKKYIDRANHLCRVMKEVSGVDIKNPHRDRLHVVSRAMVATTLLEEGMTTIQVGQILGKNHATISHYKGLMEVFLSSPGYDAEMELWEKYKKLI